MLGAVRVGAPGTNLIIHCGNADIFDQVVEPIHAGGAFQEFRDPPPIFQWVEVQEDLVKFPSNPCRG